MHTIRRDLRQFIVDNFLFGQAPTDPSFTDEESLLEGGIVDSTGILELVAFLEQHFDLMIPDDELVPENLDSVSRLVRFVEHKRALTAPITTPQREPWEHP